MRKKEIALSTVEILKKIYPDAVCSLEYIDPFQLLVATRLSAQCTDARVNLVTPALFEKFGTAEKMAKAKLYEVEELIKSCGLYKTKAKDLIALSNQIINDFDGKVPDSIEKLTSLSGVGRKTANLIMGDVYHKPAIVTDTHLIRISNRLGLADSTNPLKVEKQLLSLIPPDESSDFCHRIVLFGRDTCTARAPKCDACPLSSVCRRILPKKKSAK